MVKLNIEGTELETERPRVPALPDTELIGKVPRKANGPAKDPRTVVERGLLEYDVIAAERERLEQELKAARERIHLLEIQIEQIEATRNTIESRINACVLERDEAVRKTGELQGVLNSVAGIVERYHDTPQD